MLNDLLMLPAWVWWVFANQLAFGWVALSKLPELRDPSRARELGMRIGMLVLCVAVGILVWAAVVIVDAFNDAAFVEREAGVGDAEAELALQKFWEGRP